MSRVANNGFPEESALVVNLQEMVQLGLMGEEME